ncbi:peroxidase-related enzyme [Salisaeta longa]|uniref:peroxidase-related enzyme n=1 Tax=Salisaeta longa TaxID=503170 RepID=UPI0003B33003|nr:peroxidase-related enzyme [Salisaeta longa]
MAWIDIIDEADADGPLAAIYDEIADQRGNLSNIMRVHSLHPKAMRAHMDLYLELLFSRSDLSRATRELIAVVVSDVNDCPYCVAHHRAALRAYWKDDARIDAVLAGDLAAARVGAKQRALIDYVRRLTRAPQSMTEEHVDALRRAGLSDAAILDINLVASYFNFVNRIALGLGVSADAEEVDGYDY